MAEEASHLTAVVVPVPEAAESTGYWRSLYTDGGRRGMPPHVTLVSPWVPSSAIDGSTIERLAARVRAVGPFDFELTKVDSFPKGVLFLHVSPTDRFRAMIEAVCEEFPAHQPYAGEFTTGDVLPHVTVAVAESFPDGAKDGDRDIFAKATQTLLPHLPIPATANEVQVLYDDGTAWRVAHQVGLARE